VRLAHDLVEGLGAVFTSENAIGHKV
jgi:hypothetical protein